MRVTNHNADKTLIVLSMSDDWPPDKKKSIEKLTIIKKIGSDHEIQRRRNSHYSIYVLNWTSYLGSDGTSTSVRKL
jgi:hypothetical protein